MSKHCDDCGTRLSGDICPNCHEELLIATEQYEFMDGMSAWFASKVEEQKRAIDERKGHPIN